MKVLIILSIIIFLIYPIGCFLETGHLELQEKDCFIKTILSNNTNYGIAIIISVLIFFSSLILHRTDALLIQIKKLKVLSWLKIPIVIPIDYMYSEAIVDPQE